MAECLIAVDLATKTDIAAVSLLFEKDGKLIPFGRFYVPEAAFDVPHQATYRAWASQGKMFTTPGNIIDFDRIEADTRAECYRLRGFLVIGGMSD